MVLLAVAAVVEVVIFASFASFSALVVALLLTLFSWLLFFGGVGVSFDDAGVVVALFLLTFSEFDDDLFGLEAAAEAVCQLVSS